MKCGDLPGLSGPMAGARSLRYPHGLARALARISRCPSREVVSVVMGSMRKSAGSAGFARYGCKRLELKARQAKATEGGPWPCSAAHVPGRHRRPHPGFSSAVPGLTPPSGRCRQPKATQGRGGPCGHSFVLPHHHASHTGKGSAQLGAPKGHRSTLVRPATTLGCLGLPAPA